MADELTSDERELAIKLLRELADRGEIHVSLEFNGQFGVDIGDVYEGFLLKDYLGKEVRRIIDSSMSAEGFIKAEDYIGDLKIFSNLFTDLATMLINEIELAEMQIARVVVKEDE